MVRVQFARFVRELRLLDKDNPGFQGSFLAFDKPQIGSNTMKSNYER